MLASRCVRLLTRASQPFVKAPKIQIMDPRLSCSRPEIFNLVSRPLLSPPLAAISQGPCSWSNYSAVTGMMSPSFSFPHAIKSSKYMDARAPGRSLSDSASTEKVEEPTEKKRKYKGNTIFDVIGFLDNFGVGWRYIILIIWIFAQ
jgi:hypothetical protein